MNSLAKPNYSTSLGWSGLTPISAAVVISSTATLSRYKEGDLNGDADFSTANELAKQRDGSGATVQRRYFAEGEQRLNPIGTSPGVFFYYYSRDYLGSIRELTNERGTLVGRYEYDP